MHKYHYMCLIGWMLVAVGVVGCEQSSNFDEQLMRNHEAGAHTLTELAAKTVNTQQENIINREQSKRPISQNAQQYVGRYFTQVECTDPFVQCPEGTADFILNLLSDGTAHRTIIHLGKVTFASKLQYRQDRWSYDATAHQIILHRASGVEFFYDLDAENNLVMDLEKIRSATETNRRYFAEGNPFPSRAYTLVKIKTNE